jgi:hypothetical protein
MPMLSKLLFAFDLSVHLIYIVLYHMNSPTSDAYYRVSSYPLPLTSREAIRIETFLTLFAALFVLIPFCYLPASFVLFVVKERSVKAQHLQLVSGVYPAAYWTSTFIWDAINYLVSHSIMTLGVVMHHIAFLMIMVSVYSSWSDVLCVYFWHMVMHNLWVQQPRHLVHLHY